MTNTDFDDCSIELQLVTDLISTIAQISRSDVGDAQERLNWVHSIAAAASIITPVLDEVFDGYDPSTGYSKLKLITSNTHA